MMIGRSSVGTQVPGPWWRRISVPVANIQRFRDYVEPYISVPADIQRFRDQTEDHTVPELPGLESGYVGDVYRRMCRKTRVHGKLRPQYV
jgi:hypothetical protein